MLDASVNPDFLVAEPGKGNTERHMSDSGWSRAQTSQGQPFADCFVLGVPRLALWEWTVSKQLDMTHLLAFISRVQLPFVDNRPSYDGAHTMDEPLPFRGSRGGRGNAWPA